MATCERCGCNLDIKQLLYHEAMHDQHLLLFQAMENQLRLQDEAINLMHELITDLEARVDDVALG